MEFEPAYFARTINGTHTMLGNVRLEYAVPLIIGIIFGTQAAAYAAKRLGSKTLERILEALDA